MMLPANFEHGCSTRKRATVEKDQKVTVLCQAVTYRKMDHALD